MRGVVQVTVGILLAVVVILLVIGVGRIEVPYSDAAAPTPTALPSGTLPDRQMAALVTACGISWQAIQQALDDGYAYLPAPDGDERAAEARMLGGLMAPLQSRRPFAACEQLSCPICLVSLASGTPSPLYPP